MRRKIKYAKNDFKSSYLPKNRYEVFIDVLKVRFDIIYKSGFVLFLFLIPLIFFTLSKNVSIFALNSNYEANLFDIDTYNNYLFLVNVIFGIGQSIGLVIFSVGLSGILNIFKRLTFYESIQFKEDFVRGIKFNLKECLTTFIIAGILYFLSVLYTNMPHNNDYLSYIIFYLPIFLGVVLIVPTLILCLFQIPIYKNTYKQYFKNACFFYGKTIFKTLGILIALFIPFTTLLINNIYAMIISILIISLLILPIIILILNLYCNAIFDLYLNEKQYPEIYKKGING